MTYLDAEKLLSDENIEQAAAKSYEDFRDLNLMPEDPRWADVDDEVKVELRDGIRENVRYALDALTPASDEALRLAEEALMADRYTLPDGHDEFGEGAVTTNRATAHKGAVRVLRALTSHPTPDGEEGPCKTCGDEKFVWTGTEGTIGALRLPCPDCTPDGPASPVPGDEPEEAPDPPCARCAANRWAYPIEPVANSHGQRYIECVKCGERRIPNKLPTESNAVTEGHTAFPGTHELPEFGELPALKPVLGDEERCPDCGRADCHWHMPEIDALRAAGEEVEFTDIDLHRWIELRNALEENYLRKMAQGEERDG